MSCFGWILARAALMSVIAGQSWAGSPNTPGETPLPMTNATDSSKENRTRELASQFNLLAITLKEIIADTLNITANSMALETPPTAEDTPTLLRLALGNMCKMRQLAATLEAAATTPSGSEGDLELSALRIVVQKVYEQSCEWTVSEARVEGSALNTDNLCARLLSQSATDLCTYWDGLLVAEAAEQDMNNLFLG